MKHLFSKADRFYRHLRIQTKLTITHLIIATLPMLVLGFFFVSRLYDMIVADTISKEQAASTQTAPLIEDTVSEILDIHQEITSHEYYRRIIRSGRAESLDTISASPDALDFQNTVDRLVDEHFITQIKLYLDIPRTEYIFSEKQISDTVKPINDAWGTYWYGIFNGTPSTIKLFCPSFYLGSYEIKHYGDMAYITKTYIEHEGVHTPCYLAIYFSQEHLDDLLKNNLSSNSNVAYIINDRNNLVATSDAALSGTYHFDYSVVQDSFMSSNNFITKEILGEEVYAGFYSIHNTDWYMVVAMPSAPLFQKSLSIMFGFALVYLGCIVVALVFATWLSHSMTNRLSAVITQMSRSRTELPCALPDSDTQDEIGDLIDTYNYMTHMIHRLVEEQAKAEEELRIAEFHSLQSQMNPHFLYNTMDMINWLSQQGRSYEVTMAIQKLSRFYKLTLSRKQSLSTIQNEAEHVSTYVELQNMRFHDTIDFIVDMPDSLMEYSIPKLTFQPVVENSILHGILEKEDKEGTIVLTAWMEDDTIVILISDDGVGIPPEKLRTILTDSGKSSGSSGTNIAIYNTHRRLQLMYGTEYGLTYSSVPGVGTEVTIRIPAQRPKENPGSKERKESSPTANNPF